MNDNRAIVYTETYNKNDIYYIMIITSKNINYIITIVIENE